MARRLEEEEYLARRFARVKWEGKEEGWKTGSTQETRLRERDTRGEGWTWMEWWEERRRKGKWQQKEQEQVTLTKWADGEWVEWMKWFAQIAKPQWNIRRWELTTAEEESRYEVIVEQVVLRQMLRISKTGEEFKRVEMERGRRILRNYPRQVTFQLMEQALDQRVESAVRAREAILARALMTWTGREEMRMAQRRRELAEQGWQGTREGIIKRKQILMQRVAERRAVKEETLLLGKALEEQQVREDWEKMRQEWWIPACLELDKMSERIQRAGKEVEGRENRLEPSRGHLSKLQALEEELNSGTQEQIEEAGRNLELLYRWKGMKGIQRDTGEPSSRQGVGESKEELHSLELEQRLKTARERWHKGKGQDRGEEPEAAEHPQQPEGLKEEEASQGSAKPGKQEGEGKQATEGKAREDRGTRRRRQLKEKKQKQKEKSIGK